MSISGALNNALSGLRATGRASEVISNNISNALTPGYAPRNLELSASTIGDFGGVKIDGVVRNVDPQLLSDRRLASAEFAFRSQTNSFVERLDRMIGTPGEDGSLSSRLSDFENSLITAASRPDAPERLDMGVLAARDLATALNSVSDGIQTARTDAEAEIDRLVNRLNDALSEVQELNSNIISSRGTSSVSNALQDQRQLTIDEIAEIVPIRTVARQDGSLAIYSTGGALLLDGPAATVGFNAVRTVTPYMTIGNGLLSGLTVNGIPVDTSASGGALRGGKLAAQFEIRDETAPQAQSQLDAIARDLVERFADPAVDPTLVPGDAGLFTDAGLAFAPIDEVGLSSRIAVNALVDPSQGGQSWRLRDGLGAATPGNPGDATLLQALSQTLDTARTPASGAFGSGAFEATQLTASFMSQIGADRIRSEQQLAYSTAQFDALELLVLEQGVDTDAELQRMILVEQAYAANARIIQVADDLLELLVSIG